MSIDMEHFPTSESAQRMLESVTKGFYDNSYVAKWIFQIIGQEYDNTEKIAEELPKQFFPETATWGLCYHELKWGLPIRENLSYEERRRLIFQKRDFKAPMTPFRMETYLRNAVGFEVHILDCHDTGEYGFFPEHPNVFKAVFIGDGTLNTKMAREILDKIKQSHTVYTINDRVIDIIDNRNLEQIDVSKLSLQILFPFWKANLMDGSWDLDGSIGLDAVMQSMDTIICFGKIEAKQKEQTVALFAIRIDSQLFEQISSSMQMNTEINNKENILASADISITFKNTVENIETSVILNKNEWYLDGTFSLDGDKLLNSYVEEEAL